MRIFAIGFVFLSPVYFYYLCGYIYLGYVMPYSSWQKFAIVSVCVLLACNLILGPFYWLKRVMNNESFETKRQAILFAIWVFQMIMLIPLVQSRNVAEISNMFATF